MSEININKIKASQKQAGKSSAGTAAVFIFLFILGIFMFFPIYLAIVMSIKPVEELFIFPPKLYTLNPTLDNFSDMFETLNNMWIPFSRYVFNSFFVTAVVTVSQCVLTSMAAFVLAKCRFPGNKIINSIIVISLLYQSNAIYIMQYMVMAKMGLINSYSALILPSIASPMGLFLMKQSISQIPDSIIEAARVDGAGLFTICWKIIMPNQKPALMTLIIFAFQGAWNIQGGSFIYDESLKTLPTVVQQAAAAGISKAGVAMAAAVFMLIPPVIIFIAAQKNVMETMAHSGIKE